MITLLIATMQMSAILLVALGMLWLLRRRSASLRHAVLVIAMACAAVVPALGHLMPTWTIPFIPSFIAAPVAPLQGAVAGSPPREVATSRTSRAVQSAESTPGAPASTPTQSRNWRDALPWVIRTAYLVYMAGVAIFLLGLMIGLLRLRWIAAQGEPLRNDPWQRRAAAIAVAYRLRRTVTLVLSPSPLLATWGIVNPQVLLPAGAQEWPEARIRAVLLHELAHIRRNDWAIQVLAGLLRSIYWFNPLVWLAFARLRQEGEQACDDAAITQGEDHAEYAGQLLALARSLNATMLPLPAAPSMAMRSTLRQRIASLLDPETAHAPATARSLTVVWATLLTVTGAVAACDGLRATGEASVPVTQATEEAGPVQEAAATSIPAVDNPPAIAKAVAPPATGPAESPAPAPDRRPHVEPRSPTVITADILALVESALADESLAVLDEIQRPITGLHHVRRFARAVVDDNWRDTATQAANYLEIINALKNTATFASNITSTPRGAQLSKQKIDQLATAMRARADDLAEAVMPTPRVTSVMASTPERQAATTALDLAQSTLRNTRFTGPPSNSWLVNELDTLQRAAQSVLSDDGASESRFTTELHVLRAALLSVSRNAVNISRRPRVSPDALANARELSTSVRRIASQLAAIPRPSAADMTDTGEP